MPSTWLSFLEAYIGFHCLELNLASYAGEPDLRDQDKFKEL